MSLFNFIKTRVAIIDVVGEYTKLKKAGMYWKGHCPFHNEKTASFTVSPHKDIFYCFGCHLGGDVISFIAKTEQCSQLEAAKHLAERYNIDIPQDISPDTAKNSREQKKQYNDICKTVAQWCHQQLLKNPSIMHYLNKRGINKNSIDHFALGYFPGGLASIKSFIQAMHTHAILTLDLIKANILLEGKNVLYSPFEERILFPIKDHLGRCCGFGGRIFKQQDERAKYYNSRENDYFSKRSLLFGLDLAKKSIQKTEHVFLVEGYTDCIAMTQHGFINTVATLGTACTTDHLTSLARYAQHMCVLYDSDKAGQQAMLRLTELCWHINMELKVVILPPGEDPASFLANNQDLHPMIDNAKDIFGFFIDSAGTGFSAKSLSEKLHIVQKIIDVIQKINPPLKQDLLLHRASKMLDIPFESLKTELKSSKKRTRQSSQSPQSIHDSSSKAPPTSDQSTKLEKKIFFAIIDNMQLFHKEVDSSIIECFSQPLRDILQKLKYALNSDSTLDFVQFFDKLNEDEQQYVSKLLLEAEEQGQSQSLEILLMQLQKQHWKAMVSTIKIKLAQAQHEANEDKTKKILYDFLELKKKLLGNKLI